MAATWVRQLLQSPVAGMVMCAVNAPTLNVPAPQTTAGTSATAHWLVVGGQSTGAGVPTNSQALAGSLFVVQASHGDNGTGELWPTGPHASRILDSALADLVRDADRPRGEEADGPARRTPVGTEDIEGGAGTEPIRIDRAGFARPDEEPPRIQPADGGLIRSGSISDAVFDEPAAKAIGWPGRVAVPVDPSSDRRHREHPGEALPRLAAALILAGSWGHRARFRGVTSRRAGRPPEGKESE